MQAVFVVAIGSTFVGIEVNKSSCTLMLVLELERTYVFELVIICLALLKSMYKCNCISCVCTYFVVCSCLILFEISAMSACIINRFNFLKLLSTENI